MEFIRALPCNLILYEANAFGGRSQVYDAEPMAIGTLAIYLPSPHDGGDFHVSCDDREVVLNTSSASEYCLSALAWYSGVTQEIKPLERGTRLLFTYNITDTDGERFVKPAVQGAVRNGSGLNTLGLEWSSEYSETRCLAYPLLHSYTPTSLKFDELQYRDRTVCQALGREGSKHGYIMLLASLSQAKRSGDIAEETLFFDDDDYVYENDDESSESLYL
ncbi:hypothetical protein F5Y18DRAFT_118049 [Xylariaceae sp. FL1019]|nr:hypothetical protein F5Y18DRAFT_118049 [Xylariaceae sp. FL1019]